MASERTTTAALLAWTGCQDRDHGQGQAWFQCRPRGCVASLVRCLVHLGMPAAGAQSSSRPLLLCTAIQTVSRYLRVPDVKGRHFGNSTIVGGDDQIYTDVGAWLESAYAMLPILAQEFPKHKTPLMTCRKHELLKNFVFTSFTDRYIESKNRDGDNRYKKDKSTPPRRTRSTWSHYDHDHLPLFPPCQAGRASGVRRVKLAHIRKWVLPKTPPPYSPC
jgi:hypothetical protein